MTLEEKTKKQLVEALKDGAVGIIPTDTVYGLVCSAFDKRAVERMYKIANRDADKPFIVALASKAGLSRFGIELDSKIKKIIESVWPGEVSLIIDCNCKYFEYLHRGRNSIAFRRPKDEEFLSILQATGPLATTSANPQGMETPKTIAEAEEYFGDGVDFYVDGGHKEVIPSTIIKVDEDRRVELIREGVVSVNVDEFNTN